MAKPIARKHIDDTLSSAIYRQDEESSFINFWGLLPPIQRSLPQPFFSEFDPLDRWMAQDVISN